MLLSGNSASDQKAISPTFPLINGILIFVIFMLFNEMSKRNSNVAARKNRLSLLEPASLTRPWQQPPVYVPYYVPYVPSLSSNGGGDGMKEKVHVHQVTGSKSSSRPDKTRKRGRKSTVKESPSRSHSVGSPNGQKRSNKKKDPTSQNDKESTKNKRCLVKALNAVHRETPKKIASETSSIVRKQRPVVAEKEPKANSYFGYLKGDPYRYG